MNIAVLVSGGVDSSVALKLLKDQGHTLTAFYLKIWLEDELAFLGDCPWEQDLAYVRAVCDQLEVPLEVVPLQKEYFEHVVSYTIAEVKAGRTPNPDVFCNTRIKFGFFVEYLISQYNFGARNTLKGMGKKEACLEEKVACRSDKNPLLAREFPSGKCVSRDFDKIATGHYAQVVERNGVFHLVRAPDPIKDQTYFLSYLSQDQLGYSLFPIGHLTKPQVRQLAHHFNLPTQSRRDSQGICFLGKLSFPDFIKHYLGERQGDLIELETGKKVGKHNGFWFYTIGQRQGIGLSGGPWYVAAKDVDRNQVFISREYYTPDKQRNQFEVRAFNWLQGVPTVKKELQVKVRHGAQMHSCCIEVRAHDRIAVKLLGNDQGIASGQFAALYDGDECLGSGVIIASAGCAE